jgi:hypothetical protein
MSRTDDPPGRPAGVSSPKAVERTPEAALKARRRGPPSRRAWGERCKGSKTQIQPGETETLALRRLCERLDGLSLPLVDVNVSRARRASRRFTTLQSPTLIRWARVPFFAEMLERLLANGAKTIIVERPHRFARDLMVHSRARYVEGARRDADRCVVAHALPRGHADGQARAPGPGGDCRVRENDVGRQIGGGAQAQARDRSQGRRSQEPRRIAPRGRQEGAGSRPAQGAAASQLAGDLQGAGR